MLAFVQAIRWRAWHWPLPTFGTLGLWAIFAPKHPFWLLLHFAEATINQTQILAFPTSATLCPVITILYNTQLHTRYSINMFNNSNSSLSKCFSIHSLSSTMSSTIVLYVCFLYISESYPSLRWCYGLNCNPKMSNIETIIQWDSIWRWGLRKVIRLIGGHKVIGSLWWDQWNLVPL